jgi:HD-GYP domain-containing protein (c-di-GMP phosphodiesterase class II)
MTVNSEERIPLGQVADLVRLGEPLPFRVLDAQARMLLAQGQKLLSEDQLAMLLERGAWVERQQVVLLRSQRQQGSATMVPSGYRHRTLFDAWEQLVWQLDRLLKRAQQRHPVAEDLAAFGSEIVRLIDRDADVALFMAVRQDVPRFALYALTHGIYTAVVAVLASRQLGWTTEQQLTICCAALTMNMSICELQAEMAEQKERPSQRQFDIIRNHPQRSAELLQGCGVSDALWLSTVTDHHERRGGSGYPRKLVEVGEPAALLRKSDVYMAKISPRAQRAALPPRLAARQLYEDEGGGPLAAALIKPLGVYPPGDLVKLRNGEIGVVTRRATSSNGTLVASITNKLGKATAQTQLRDTRDAEFTIDGDLSDRGMLGRILPERVYGLIDP